MGRLKEIDGNVRFSRDCGRHCKRDTPMKISPIRGRGKSRGLLSKIRLEPLPEEPLPNETKVPTVKPSIRLCTNRKPTQFKKAVHFSSPLFMEGLGEKNLLATTPTNQNAGVQVLTLNPACAMTPDPRAFEGGLGTLERVATTGMAQTTLVSSDDSVEDSDFSSSSSLPSPEICREDNYVESFAFPTEEEPLDLCVKNSTLLDMSHAENIHMHQPNLSIIMDASMIPAEKEPKLRAAAVEPKRCMESFKADNLYKRPTPKLSDRRPIRCYKKVLFSSPVVVEGHTSKNIPAAKLTNQNTGDLVLMFSPANRMTSDAETVKAGEICPKEDTRPLTVTLKTPVNTSLGPAKFWDFADDNDRDGFFQRWRNRSARLKSAPDFLSKTYG